MISRATTESPSWIVGGVPLSGAQATALASLRARSHDARNALSLLRDSHAVELADRLNLGPSVPVKTPREAPEPCSARAAVLRSVVIDAWVRECFAATPTGTVIELGAGFTTRCERLDDHRLRWLELDLPAVVELRRRFLAPNPRREHLAGSVTDTGWLDRVAASPPAYCFIFEAVLAYLPPEQVPGLLAHIVRRFPGASVILDVPRAWWHDRDPFAEIEAWNIGLMLEQSTSLLEHCVYPRCVSGGRGAYRVARFRAVGSPSPELSAPR